MKNKRQSKNIVVWKAMGLWGLFSNNKTEYNVDEQYHHICCTRPWLSAYMKKIIPETRHTHYIRYLRLYYYHWVDISAGG